MNANSNQTSAPPATSSGLYGAVQMQAEVKNTMALVKRRLVRKIMGVFDETGDVKYLTKRDELTDQVQITSGASQSKLLYTETGNPDKGMILAQNVYDLAAMAAASLGSPPDAFFNMAVIEETDAEMQSKMQDYTPWKMSTEDLTHLYA